MPPCEETDGESHLGRDSALGLHSTQSTMVLAGRPPNNARSYDGRSKIDSLQVHMLHSIPRSHRPRSVKAVGRGAPGSCSSFPILAERSRGPSLAMDRTNPRRDGRYMYWDMSSMVCPIDSSFSLIIPPTLTPFHNNIYQEAYNQHHALDLIRDQHHTSRTEIHT